MPELKSGIDGAREDQSACVQRYVVGTTQGEQVAFVVASAANARFHVMEVQVGPQLAARTWQRR